MRGNDYNLCSYTPIEIGWNALTYLCVSENNWTAPSGGGTSSAVNVTSSGAVITYSVTDNADWLTISSSGGTTPGSFTMTAAVNTTGSTRMCTVTVTATSPAGTTGSPQTITATQQSAPPTLSVDMSTWGNVLPGGGTSSAVNVTSSGAAITYTISDDADWLTISSSGGTTPGNFTMTAAANNIGSTRTGTITVTATSPAGTIDSPQTISVTQDYDSGVEYSSENLPTSYALYQNHPNPFNPTTTIRYDIPKGSEIRLSVFDLRGREVETLVEVYQEAGVYLVLFDSKELSSGLYYRLQTKETVLTRKLMLIR
jgi:hypothetical protein